MMKFYSIDVLRYRHSSDYRREGTLVCLHPQRRRTDAAIEVSNFIS